MTPLTLAETDVLELERLPDHHQDPFDRMLVCQARANDLVLLTPDKRIHAYSVATAW